MEVYTGSWSIKINIRAAPWCTMLTALDLPLLSWVVSVMDAMGSLSSSPSRFRIAAIFTRSSGQGISPWTMFFRSGNDGDALIGGGSSGFLGLRRKENIDDERLTFQDNWSFSFKSETRVVHKKKGVERERGGREKLAVRKVSQPTRCNLVAPLTTLGRYAPWSPWERQSFLEYSRLRN